MPCLARFQHPTVPTTQDWDDFRPLITQMYIDEDKKLKEVQDHLLEKYNFRATTRMYNARLTKWRLSKTLRKQNVAAISQQLESYRDQHGSAPTSIEINGKYVDAAKVHRSLRRHKQRDTRKQADPVEDVHAGEGAHIEIEETEDPIPLAPWCEQYSPSQIMITDPLCETNSDTAVLTSAELTNVCVAIIQIDFSSCDVKRKGRTPGPESRRHNSSPPSWSPTPSLYTLQQPQELQDLEFVLLETHAYYRQLGIRRSNGNCVGNQYSCSPTERSNARDLYARYWIGFLLLDHPQKSDLGMSFLNDDSDRTVELFENEHPHSLTWICFIACYPPSHPDKEQQAWRRLHQQRYLISAEYGSIMFSEEISPLALVTRRLYKTDQFRRDICLRVLRSVITIFGLETKDKYLEDANTLSRLFDHVAEEVQQDEETIETTLRQWASASESIGRLIHHERSNAKIA